MSTVIEFPNASLPKRALPYLVLKKIPSAKEESLKKNTYLTPQEVVLLAKKSLQKNSVSCEKTAVEETSSKQKRRYRRISSQEGTQETKSSLKKEETTPQKILPFVQLSPLSVKGKI